MSGMQREVGGGIRFGPTALIEAAQWTRERLAAFDVGIPAGSRLQRAQLLLHQVNERRVVLVLEDDATLDRVTEAQWTILEQYTIARALGRPGRPLRDEHRRKLVEMLSGNDSPESDRNPLGRNTQFELYVAALLTMGNVQCHISEPDLIFNYLGQPTGLAAKRVQSLKKAVSRADEAADQLDSTRIQGVIAVNVDVLLKTAPTLPDPEATLDERLGVVEQIESRMADRPSVLATLTLGRTCEWNFGGAKPHASPSNFIRFTSHPRKAGDKEKGEEFFRRLMGHIERRMATL